MHYYKFNISDWALHTAHLSLVEEAIYFRLINHYYDTERPIPLETQSVFRRLRMANESDIAQEILEEFFDKTKKGFTHKRCDKILAEYSKTAERNKKNGAKGGRPRAGAASKQSQEKPSGLSVGTEDKPKDNPNQELLTNNQELLTKNNNKSPSAQIDFEPLGMSDEQVKEVKRIRKANKGGPLTQRVVNALAKEFHEASAKGFTFDELLTEWEMRGWKSLKAEWIKPKQLNGNVFNGMTSNEQKTLEVIQNCILE